MGKTIHYAVAGVIAAAMMVLAKLLLAQQAVLVTGWHYPPFDLSGAAGLQTLGIFAIYGAAYAVAYGLLLKALVPGGIILGSLALGAVPTLVSALVLPLYHGQAALKDKWILLWLYAHWVLFALVLLFIVPKKGGGKGSKDED